MVIALEVFGATLDVFDLVGIGPGEVTPAVDSAGLVGLRAESGCKEGTGEKGEKEGVEMHCGLLRGVS